MATTTPLQLGMMGLGRMGANLVRRALRDGHRCVAYDLSADAVAGAAADGAAPAHTLDELVAHLEEFSGRVSDSGEGRWTSIAAIEEGVPTPVLTTALQARFASRDEDDFANRVLSALRLQFGGHREKPS